MRKISKKWKIFITTVVILIGSFYGYYKINNRNAFEEMYNSYYNVLPLKAIDNMPQVKPISKKLREQDIVLIEYKENKCDGDVKIFLIKPEDRKKINIDLLLVPAVFWKNKFDNLPLERKEQKEFMMNKFNELTGKIADSDDVADAYMMLKACLGG